MDRRHFIKGLAASTAGSTLLSRSSRAQTSPQEPYFVIVLAGSGGASIIDATLAIRASESTQASTINCFPDAMVQSIADSPFRAVDQTHSSLGPIPIGFTANQSNFVSKYHQDMMVVTQTSTSVNHAVGQRRSVTGNEAWAGRTLQECVAATYGADFTLPNVNLATGTNFIARGNDDTLPAYAFGETVGDPALWPLALDGSRGLNTPSAELLEKARTLRDEQLDPRSRFHRVFGRSPLLQTWQRQRRGPRQAIEKQDLISKLMLFPNSSKYPLEQFGLSPSPAGDMVRAQFPEFETDPLQAQAALAFLLIKFRVSVAVTLGPRFDLVLAGDEEERQRLREQIRNGGGGQALPPGILKNPPIAFDFSHQSHRACQALMWDRLYRTIDGLVTLLKSEEYTNGQSLWDRTLIYVATDFGRTKNRPADAPDFSTSHDLNNGLLVVSPLVNGNKILGGVNPDTGLTYGFDPQTGAPNPNQSMSEGQVFAGLLQALKVDTSPARLPDMPAMRKA